MSLRKTALYLVALTVASAMVFLLAYLFGRHSSLESELELLTAPRGPVPEKSQGIPSLRPLEPPPAPATVPGEPEGRTIGEGVRLRITPLEEPGIVIVLDLEALAAGRAGSARPRDNGLRSFLAQPPAGVRLGLRALSGAPGDCGVTSLLAASGHGTPEELRFALDAALAHDQGPRNPARAVREAAADLDGVTGERAIVILAGGADACGADLCGDAAALVGSPRVHAVLLAPTPPPADAGGGAGGGSGAAPTFSPAWAAPLQCLVDRTGGTLSVAVTPEELEGALRRIAKGVESAVTVRALHLLGQDLQGLSPDAGSTWGASLAAPGEESGAVRTSPVLPARFAVAAGTWDVRLWFAGLERTVTVPVAPGERAEVIVSLSTGELYVQAKDDGGDEIAGDSEGFGCGWGVEVMREGDEKPAGSTCSLPARFELPPGDYWVRVRWQRQVRDLESVVVEGGGSAVRTVDFSAPEE